jgi:hypothetical protein
MPESFFVPRAANLFTPTDHTRGPWGAESQHGGPPASLLGRAVEAANDRTDMAVARITFEILRPIPVRDLSVTTDVIRPGRSVEMVEAGLWDDGTEVMRARAWRIRIGELDVRTPVAPPPAGPGDSVDAEPLPTPYEGYLHAMEMRSVHGGLNEPGPGTVWFRMRYPLLPDEAPSPLTRVLIAADSASGISAVLDWHEWLFINTDLTVHLHRKPAGEWICLDAETTVQPTGVGLAASVVYDEEGSIGLTSQSLFVDRRTSL